MCVLCGFLILLASPFIFLFRVSVQVIIWDNRSRHFGEEHIIPVNLQSVLKVFQKEERERDTVFVRGGKRVK